MLHGIGAPASENNMAILSQWAHWEGTTARYNYLATCWKEPGSTRFNHACPPGGVQNYASSSSGADATAHTLKDGYYPDILAAFRADKPLSQWHTAAIRAQIHKWGTGGFARTLG